MKLRGGEQLVLPGLGKAEKPRRKAAPPNPRGEPERAFQLMRQRAENDDAEENPDDPR